MRRARRRSSAYELKLEPEQLEQLKLELVENLRPARKLGPEFTEFATRFLVWAHTERQKPSSLVAKSSALRLYLTPRFIGRRLGEITDSDVLELKQQLAGRSAKTVNNVLCVLRKMLRLAVRWRELEYVPVTIEGLKVDRPPVEFYDFEQYAKLIDAAKRESQAIAAMILLAGDGGLRMGELLALEWGDVDLRRGEIVVRRSEWKGFVTAPKNGFTRTIPMTRALLLELQELERSLKDQTIDKRSLRLLVHPDGRKLTTEGIRNWTRRAQKRAGLPISGRLHVLRHTFCSHLAMSGAAAIAIQGLAGHETGCTTERYMHLAPAERIKTIGLLDARRSNAGVATRETL